MSSQYPTRQPRDRGQQEPPPDGVPYPRYWPVDGSAPQSPPVGVRDPSRTMVAGQSQTPYRAAGYGDEDLYPNRRAPSSQSQGIPLAGGSGETSRIRPGTGGGRGSTRYKIEVRSLRLIWSVIFFTVVFLPLALAPMAGGEKRPWSSGGIAIELCLTTGLLSLSLLAATVILPSRMRSISRAFGIEGVLRSHRLLALITTGLVLVHVAFVVVDRPMNVVLLYPVTGPPRARAGEVATVALLLLCYLSLRRRKMGTRYEMWRMMHALLAVAAIAGTYAHIYFLNHLMQNLAERSVFYAILLFIIGVFANRWLLRPFKARRRAYVIKGVRSETPTTSTMVLAPARRRQRALKYRAGQFVWIRMDSPFGPLQGHPFTIASAPHAPRELEFTIRNAGDFTGSIVVLTPGRKVFVDGPYGDFNADHLNCKSLLLVSAGIGITPMMSLLRSHAHRRDRRPHVLLACARTEDELMFRDELRHLEKIMNLTVIEILSSPPPGWTGFGRRLDREVLEEIFATRSSLRSPSVFVCGPTRMMTDVRTMLAEVGVEERNIHTEDFSMV
jgi:predicted ferric reductase